MQETCNGKAPACPNDWASVQTWRKAIREKLIAERIHVPISERRAVQQKIGELLRSNFSELNRATIGFYWPIKGEIDLRPLLKDFLAAGARAALPVVVEKNQPVEFWEWHGETSMSRSIGNIPAPVERKPVQTDVLLIPLLGFDITGHRLGYGGGYYDRTLAALD
ncbi:MAG: 5-formyltetrahydrofolate cyclo-ligase, partial [Halioglobus sp.]|nr:5-formyltetrahydrofolate cyclo-ligase [Halioglobus sp.]